MTGRETLTEVRADLEDALGTGPKGGSDVAESLRRFLAAGAVAGTAPKPATEPAGNEKGNEKGTRTVS